MTENEIRELAREISGKPSISSLSLEERSVLIEILKERGAKIRNPDLEDRRERVYFEHLDYWNERFPRPRPGFASNSQLAWIQTLWELDFDDGRTAPKRGLRGFIFRQTRNLEDGPVGDLAFVRESHVQSILSPLKEKARKGSQQ
jgi:hypothetical protein